MSVIDNQHIYRPAITFIMASKHHNTRFCGRGAHLQIGKSKNLPAGLCVDTHVTSSDKFDFFVGSSQGIQGTSISSHYYVLHDDNNLSADAAQVILKNPDEQIRIHFI